MSDRPCYVCNATPSDPCLAVDGQVEECPRSLGARRFRVEVECAGSPFVWSGPADTERQAFRRAAQAIAEDRPEVRADQVRVIACVEVAA